MPHSSRISKESSSVFGLIAWLEATRIVLPLRAVDCRFQAVGETVSVEIHQVFVQSNPEALDCEYTFPLPTGAAIHRCEVHINKRVLVAKVMEENTARSLAEKQRALGHRTALVTAVRENLFTLQLGNVQPGDTVTVRLCYFESIRRLGNWASFHIPFCPGIRYVPGEPLLRSPSGNGTISDTDRVPDASKISPPRLDPDSEDAARLYVSGSLDNAHNALGEVSSPSHLILVKDYERAFGVTLTGYGSLPDQDFVLRWKERDVDEIDIAAWSWVVGEDTYAMVRMLAPTTPQGMDAKGSDTKGRDVYFLLDRSFSMSGLKWDNTARAFLEFLKTMREGDRAWLTVFSASFQDFSEKPLRPDEILSDRRAQALVQLGTDGGTELAPAMAHVIGQTKKFSSNREAVLMLITDGQVGNEEEILSLAANAPDLAIHVLGIDVTPNDSLMKGLGDRVGSSWHPMHPNDDLVETVKRMGARLRSPAFESLSVGSEWEPAGPLPTRIYAGEARVMCLKKTGVSPGSLELRGQSSHGEWSVFKPTLHPSRELVEKLWQKHRIAALLSEGRTTAAVELAVACNLLCRGTSFIAWDDSEKVAISSRNIYNPALRTMYNKLPSYLMAGCYDSPPPGPQIMDGFDLDRARDRDHETMAFASAGAQWEDSKKFESSSGAGGLWDGLDKLPTQLEGLATTLRSNAARKAWSNLVQTLLRALVELGERRTEKLAELGQVMRSAESSGKPASRTLLTILDWFESWVSTEVHDPDPAKVAILKARAELINMP
ncbi:MAG: VWA domain-containing protein [Verrucomicrobia bacterium]|nr:VWA domain-containing protein [Verrucomicrobiota bacterium]